MKRGIIATIILLLCIIFSLATNITLQHKAERLYTLAHSAAEDKAKFIDFEKEWNKQILFFSLFIDHNDFEEIGRQTEKAEFLNAEQYKDACAEIIAILTHINKQLSYSVSNVF